MLCMQIDQYTIIRKNVHTVNHTEINLTKLKFRQYV
jgi:hypothetical protein